ncbi:MAG: DNA-binding protein WhiA [Clostridiales bacterium GWF2_36_10]|nr:MAG: DNA-binding protein WhiA [Clostridiales bacterium GWF2_36_10]HAN21852.1 DNA-binding protein WhiA [Clostridiales bacterium]
MSFSSDIKDYLCNIQEKRPCCRSAYLNGFDGLEFETVCEKDSACFVRGVFIKSGFVSPPENNNGLTMTFSDDFIFYVNGVLEDAGMEAKIGKRKDKPILYYKESEKIEDFLAFIGASKFTLIMMEQKVIKELRSNANRIRNAETANLDRMARAAAEQCEAISFLIEKKEYSKLPSELKECADLRMANPDMSLDELRGLLNHPISKSGINHRFKKIIEIAEHIK